MNKGMVFAGAVLIAASFAVLFGDILFIPMSTVSAGPVTISDISEQSAMRIGAFAIIFLAGVGLMTAGLKSKSRAIRKKH